MAVSIAEFEKALVSLEEALLHPKTKMNRDASIQRFEFTVELGWKVARKKMGTAETAPKEVVRQMAQNGLITEVELWIDAIDARNLSSHTYNEDVAETVYAAAVAFLPLARKFLEKLKA